MRFSDPNAEYYFTEIDKHDIEDLYIEDGNS